MHAPDAAMHVTLAAIVAATATAAIKVLQATPVLHNLRIFFIDSFDRGDLTVKPVSAEDKSAEAVYAAWLHRQYTAYQVGLLGLVGDAAVDARTQVKPC